MKYNIVNLNELGVNNLFCGIVNSVCRLCMRYGLFYVCKGYCTYDAWSICLSGSVTYVFVIYILMIYLLS